ncbi:hypothetical protein GGF32_006563, partial [Allomyces javanicus]
MLSADFIHCEQQASSRYPAHTIVLYLASRMRIAPYQPSVEVSTYPLARTIEPHAVAQDWHVELSGVNMWVHVVTGLQPFWLAPPTEGNMAALRPRVMGEDVGSDAAFVNLLEGVQFAAVGSRLTLFVPSGWLHATHAPVDTYGFVGTFYSWLSVATALAITRFENDMKIERADRH